MNKWMVVALGIGIGVAVVAGTARAQDPELRQAACMREAVTMTKKPASRAERFMNEQIAAGKQDFVWLGSGGGTGLLCAW